MNYVPTKQDYNEAPPYYEQQGQGMPPQAYAAPAQAVPAQAISAEALPVYSAPAQIALPGQTMNIAICKGCGRQFIRQPGVNPASAQFHRCDNCNRRQGNEMLCLNATCGASSLCTIQ